MLLIEGSGCSAKQTQTWRPLGCRVIMLGEIPGKKETDVLTRGQSSGAHSRH